MGYTFSDNILDLNKFIENEVVFPGDIKRPDKNNNDVKHVQEWLNFHGLAIEIDRDFGPITENKVRAFQVLKGLPITGIVDEDTFSALVAPMVNVLRVTGITGGSFNSELISHANRHLNAGACEVGGDNHGPWVRLYMDGKDGLDQPWCAGFSRFLMRQAKETSGQPMPIKGHVGCDENAEQAKAKGLFVRGLNVDPSVIAPGSLFLRRKSGTDWTHMGVVTNAGGNGFDTIEGNTNFQQGSNGNAVRALSRGYGTYDFIVFNNAVPSVNVPIPNPQALVANKPNITVNRYFYDGETVTTYGSLYAHWNGWITAGHVIRDTEFNTPPYAVGDLEFQPAGMDAALIGVDLPATRPPNIQRNDPIIVCGFPAGSDTPATRRGIAYTYLGPQAGSTTAFGKWIIRIDSPPEPVVSGMSGGVAVNANTGEPVGVIIEANFKADLDQQADPEDDHSLNIVSLHDIWQAVKHGVPSP